MKISEKGLKLIKEFEGCKLSAYQDSVGVWTIGYGTTNADKAITGTTICKGLRISQDTADVWLWKSVNNKYGPKVDKYSKYEWNQNEFDALTSFAYNIGSIDQLTATGSRTKEQIAKKILEYNKAGGKVLAGLTRRRQAEHNLFITPVTKTGWQQEDSHWRFYYHDKSGTYVRNAWYEDNGKWYMFDDAGFMLVDCWMDYKGHRCYLGHDGAMIAGLQRISDKWYYFDADGYLVMNPITLVPGQDGALQVLP